MRYSRFSVVLAIVGGALILVLAMGSTADAALINVLNSGSKVSPGANTATLSFDAGATADKLVVQLSAETSAGPTVVTYNGTPLTLAAGTVDGRNKGIWYLDNPYTGGAADLTVDMTGIGTVNGIGLGVVSISGSAPGVAATAVSTTSSVTITPTAADNFVLAGFGAQGGADGAANAPLAPIYGGDIGSAAGAAGRQIGVGAALQTYSFSGGDTPRTSNAAAFAADAPAGASVVRIETTDGTVGVSGQLDYDDGGGFGGTQWHVKNSGIPSSTTRKGYIRFDTSGLNFATTTAAALDLTVSLIDSGIGGDDQTIHVYGITDETLDGWSTSGMTWTNAPANDTGSPHAADLTDATLLGTLTLDYNGDKAVRAGTVVRLSNQALTDFIDADTNGAATFLLGRTGTNDNLNLLFAGDTHATYAPPALTVEGVVPEPGTFALAALALLGLGLFGRRRRRRST